MRHLSTRSATSKWVLPVQLIGLGIGLIGFLQIIAASDERGIVVAVIGSLIWQGGTLLKERSPLFRLLSTTPARDVMRTERVEVPCWLKVGKVAEQLSASKDQSFFVTMQDGHESGITLPEQIRTASEDDSHYMPVGQFAQQISYVDSIRDDESLLASLTRMERGRHDYVPVLDDREHLVGVVTRVELAKFLSTHNSVPTCRVLTNVGKAQN
jgi:CBS domain-containing protein